MDITSFFKESIKKKRQQEKKPEWYEDPNESYVVIYATVASKTIWNGTSLVPNQSIKCRVCGRNDHWKLGGHSGFLPQQEECIVFICEHEPISLGRLGVRCVVSIPKRFVS